MEYKLVREKRKTLVIRILDNCDVLVKAPKKCSLKFINNFIESKQKWIAENINKVKTSNIIYDEFLSLKSILIFGEKYKILDDGKKYVINDYVLKHTNSSNKQNVIKKFLFKLSNEYITKRCDELAVGLNLKYKDIKIISSRSKWGSCNNLKQLKFNFRLVCLPKEIIDYVICHELCHIMQLNHSKEFWELLKGMGYDKNAVKQAFKPYNFVLKLL